jgi:hypothetical protein
LRNFSTKFARTQCVDDDRELLGAGGGRGERKVKRTRSQKLAQACSSDADKEQTEQQQLTNTSKQQPNKSAPACRINYQLHKRCDMIAVLQIKRPAKAYATAKAGLTQAKEVSQWLRPMTAYPKSKSASPQHQSSWRFTVRVARSKKN